jgi:hypothetical protein
MGFMKKKCGWWVGRIARLEIYDPQWWVHLLCKKNHSCVSNESFILHEELSVITTKLLMGYYTLLNCVGWTSLTRISLSLLCTADMFISYVFYLFISYLIVPSSRTQIVLLSRWVAGRKWGNTLFANDDRTSINHRSVQKTWQHTHPARGVMCLIYVDSRMHHQLRLRVLIHFIFDSIDTILPLTQCCMIIIFFSLPAPNVKE